jgi:hypothetical protein
MRAGSSSINAFTAANGFDSQPDSSALQYTLPSPADFSASPVDMTSAPLRNTDVDDPFTQAIDGVQFAIDIANRHPVIVPILQRALDELKGARRAPVASPSRSSAPSSSSAIASSSAGEPASSSSSAIASSGSSAVASNKRKSVVASARANVAASRTNESKASALPTKPVRLSDDALDELIATRPRPNGFTDNLHKPWREAITWAVGALRQMGEPRSQRSFKKAESIGLLYTLDGLAYLFQPYDNSNEKIKGSTLGNIEPTTDGSRQQLLKQFARFLLGHAFRAAIRNSNTMPRSDICEACGLDSIGKWSQTEHMDPGLRKFDRAFRELEQKRTKA